MGAYGLGGARQMILGDQGPVLVVSGRAAALLAGPLQSLMAAAQRRDGVRFDPELVAVVTEMERVAGEYRRHVAASLATKSEHVGTPELPTCEPVRTMSSMEVAGLLGCSDTNVRGLARRGSLQGRRASPRSPWRFDPLDVHAYIATLRETA